MSEALSIASVRQGGENKPPRILLYGTEGIGKTTLAAAAPNPIFLQTEDGLGLISAPTFGLLKTYDKVMEAIGVLYQEDHDFKTVVVDSVDWLETLVWQSAAQANGWKDIEQPGYGRGYVAALDAWRPILEGLNALRDDRGMTIILIAHCNIKRFEAPDTEPYDRYIIKLHDKASGLVRENVDCVFFANYRISTVKTDAGFGKKVVRGVGGSERLIHTVERPAYLAKNRYSMPESLPMDWAEISTCIPYFNSQNQDQ